MARFPWFKFFPTDWLADASLASVSLQARGLWIELICLAHACNPTGVLATNREAWSRDRIYRSIKGDVNVTRAAFDELVGAGVLSQFGDDGLIPGAYYSRRMVRDAEQRDNTRERVRKYRSHNDMERVTHEKRKSNAEVTQKKRECNGEKSEVRFVDVVGASPPSGGDDPKTDARVRSLLQRPDWLPAKHGWITRRMARELALTPGIGAVTAEEFKAIMADARQGVSGLRNPAGYVIDELRKAASAKRGVA